MSYIDLLALSFAIGAISTIPCIALAIHDQRLGLSDKKGRARRGMPRKK